MNRNPEKIRELEIQGITDFESAQNFLINRLASSRHRLFSGQFGLQRTRVWLRELGDPQESYSIIHIAGTSGKGSIAYMVSNILSEANYEVGTITSPHVYDIRERLMLNSNFVSMNKFTELTKNLIAPITAMEATEYGKPTYFEAMIGMAHKCFAEYNVDFAVVETGIGGRFDSTNTIKRNDKLAVITRLGLDHTEILGNTSEEIAWQKAGIIPKNGHVIALLPENKKAQKVIEKVANERSATLEFIEPNRRINNLFQSINGMKFNYISDTSQIKNITLPLLGEYQAENTCLAIAAVEYLNKRDNLKIKLNHIKSALENTNIPARAEVTSLHNTQVIIDSAHNPQKLESFFELITSLKLPQKPIIIYSSKKSKDWQTSIPLISKNADKVFVTDFFTKKPGLLHSYAVNPKQIASKINNLGGKARPYNVPIDALSAALSEAHKKQPIIITGSMYMLGELHDQLHLLR